MPKKVLSGKDNTNGFQKNPQNINKEGRPVGSKNRATILEKWGVCKVDAKHPQSKETVKVSLEDAMALALWRKALSGDVPAIKEIQDTLHGKIKEVTETKTGLSVNKELEQLLDAWITQK